MSLSLTTIENELKSRAANLGGFNSTSAQNRLRYAILRGLQTLSNLRDWRWLNQTASLSVSSGNLGPYSPPASFLRFAALKQAALFGFVDKDTVGPILSTDSKFYTPYFRIEDEMIYFFEDPGDTTVTLNYVAEVARDITETELNTSLSIVPNGLGPALCDYAMADLLRYMPSGVGMVPGMLQSARALAEDYWGQEFLGNTQRGISPKGVNKQGIDSHAATPSFGYSGRRFN